MADADAVLASLTALYEASGKHHYGASQAGADLAKAARPAGASVSANLAGDGPGGVSFLAHALQCAAAAEAAHPADEELIAAALLHDVGWLLPRPAEGALLTAAPGTAGTAEEVFIARHDATGAAHLRALGFSHRLCALVAGHVAAKRYLVATEPAYAAALSPGSTWTLAQQGGPMSPAEAAAFAAHPLTPLCLALRRWDEAAKVPGLATPPWEAHAPRLRRVLAAAAAQWAPLASPALPPALRLGAVAPQAGASPLGPAGPGFAVVRSWLAPSEVEALRAYAAEVPCFPASQAFHTYERNGDGAVVPSRTEHFAHIEDAGGVGAFLREGRLRELCSALREGRPFALYKGEAWLAGVSARRARGVPMGAGSHASLCSLLSPPLHSHSRTPFPPFLRSLRRAQRR
jgi:predicted HD phosphohydrolase